MSMQLMSEMLLKREIKRYEESPELMRESGVLYYLCKKELSVIKKLKISEIDMTGKTEEVNQRIENQTIYFMNPQEFEEMEKKAKMYNSIAKFIKENESQ